MEFALKSIIVCGRDTFGLKTDSLACQYQVFLSLSFKGPLFVLMDVR